MEREEGGDSVPVPDDAPPGGGDLVALDLHHLAGEVGEDLLHVARGEGAALPGQV